MSLEQLVSEAVAELGPETKGRDIAWKIGPLPVCYGDRSLLKLVVLNLVSNAIKFTRMRPRAEIEIGCVGRNRDEVEIFVRATGQASICSMSINYSACFSVCICPSSSRALE
jgi:signal transduction histidine kinase